MLSAAHLVQALGEPGFQFLSARDTRALLGENNLADWAAFADSWNRLDIDTYMADQGRYRRRRHGVFAVRHGSLVRATHRAHFQGLDYNPLNGGIERWYTPIDDSVAQGQTLVAILAWCHRTFSALRPAEDFWDVEVHQFRIEAQDGVHGRPTPEGMHRDGVDFVLVLLVERHNVVSGTTIIGDAAGHAQGSFTLTEPLDAMMLDDHRVYHGVTPIEPERAGEAAFRDVLVVTFRAAPPA